MKDVSDDEKNELKANAISPPPSLSLSASCTQPNKLQVRCSGREEKERDEQRGQASLYRRGQAVVRAYASAKAGSSRDGWAVGVNVDADRVVNGITELGGSARGCEWTLIGGEWHQRDRWLRTWV